MAQIANLLWLWCFGYIALYYATPFLSHFIADTENPACKTLPKQFSPKYAYFSFQYGYGLVSLALTVRNIFGLLAVIAIVHSFDLEVSI